jgi:DNA invertase Pin-like site-specific DNA recombinase
MIGKTPELCRHGSPREQHGLSPWQKYLAEVDGFAISFAQESDRWGIVVMQIGYARVSTEDQHVDLQFDALTRAGCQRLFCEKVSGAGPQRPELLRMLEQLRAGDTVVVWKLDRLARSTRDLLATVETIRAAGATFRSLSEPWADTTSHGGKFILTVFAGMAEFERELIRERTRAGREVAKRRGVRFGRPKKLNAEQRGLALRLRAEGKSAKEVAHIFGVHVSTIYRLSDLSIV